MAISEKLQKVVDDVKSQPETVAKEIDIPIVFALQIATTICERADRDKVYLQKCKYDVTNIEKISLLIDALRHLASVYSEIRFDQPEMYKSFIKLREEAEFLRFEMLCALDLIAAEDENLKATIGRIREGGSNADLIQDLSDLLVICESNKALLDGIGFDMSILEKVQEVYPELSKLLAKATLDRSESPELRIDRDKAFGMLIKNLTTLNNYGKYAFRLNAAKASAYSINYTPRKRTKKEPELAATVA
jgi:hypothetical protein